jgi:hypothetical protein
MVGASVGVLANMAGVCIGIEGVKLMAEDLLKGVDLLHRHGRKSRNHRLYHRLVVALV